MPDPSSGQSCHLPARTDDDEFAIIRRLLNCKTIAVVGLSDDPTRASYGVSKYMQRAGYKIIPVNPKYQIVLGEVCYPTLESVSEKIDLVNVFRRPLACAEIVQEAIKLGIKGVWLQSGIINEQAAKLAKGAEIDFLQDRCIMIEHLHAR